MGGVFEEMYKKRQRRFWKNHRKIINTFSPCASNMEMGLKVVLSCCYNINPMIPNIGKVTDQAGILSKSNFPVFGPLVLAIEAP